MDNYILECCVDSAESALTAAEKGADRLELCAGLIIGGITPGIALFEQIRRYSSIPIRVLLRPRFGDFLYTEHEFEILKREAELFRKAGAQGIVIGCLTKEGSLHIPQMKALMEAAGDMKVTLHRAFDVCANPFETYEQARELGIDTILTSGQEETCLKGIELLKKLGKYRKEKGGPKLMAGAGITPEVIRQFLIQTDITCYHMSAKKLADSGMCYRKEGVPMGIPAMSEYSIFRTDGETVAKAKKILSEWRGLNN
ncbi:copper homeostasis protein CutC [Parablautia intestinalis]|uniref:PF03932 family protein CutC n=1 Tax=Parablautia intestinalis TaxID=2320100 RepID=A0A3A9AQ54_9FIRM|nr:copper homeostasis protein CutC [Parablautia intestinalis]MDE7047532.1 copper homeostasis protein CutC [Lachnospiraceae bacterium]RKI89386.1 copper homeostasis protein CutC [Parablautia intestinalis]